MLENTEGAIKKVREYRRSNQKCQRIPKEQSKMDNPEKLATKGTEDEEQQNKNTTQHVLDTTIRK